MPLKNVHLVKPLALFMSPLAVLLFLILLIIFTARDEELLLTLVLLFVRMLIVVWKGGLLVKMKFGLNIMHLVPEHVPEGLVVGEYLVIFLAERLIDF